jgi:Sigma-70 region 2
MFGKRPNAPEQLRSLPDEVLCCEATGGNHDAFLVLFDRYCKDVFRLAYSVLRNKAEAEDLVQGLFLEVHTTMLRYVVVAGQLAPMFSLPLSLSWVGGQTLLMGFVIRSHFSLEIALALSVSWLGSQIFTVLMSQAAAREAAARNELAKLNAELRATQLLLVDSGQVAGTHADCPRTARLGWSPFDWTQPQFGGRQPSRSRQGARAHPDSTVSYQTPFAGRP